MAHGVAQGLGRGQRRFLVSMTYVCLVVYVGTFLTTESSPWFWFGLPAFVAAVAIYFWLLAPFTQRIADEKDTKLDERQMVVRNHAHRTAYRILGSLLIVALTYLHLSVGVLDNRPWTLQISEDDITPIFTGALWLIITLPTAIIAWNEPDPIPDE